MSSRTLIFPSFDTLELNEPAEPATTNFQRLAPAGTGDLVAGLRTSPGNGYGHRFFNDIILDTNPPAFRYHHKPLLLYFYEQDWGPVSQQHLLQLNAISQELHYRHINLLIITARSLQAFKEQSWIHSLFLEVYEDTHNALAGLLRLYGPQSPSWSRYTGIEHNIALPGLYLLDYLRRVAFAHPNEEIRAELPIERVLETLSPNIHPSERKSA